MTDVAARSRRVELTHIDGLDGLRGLAVGAVVLYHGVITWATGGFLGVELFFVLSGFLITSLLVREWLSTGGIRLSNFWARRARRLLPALFVLVVVIGIYYSTKGTLGAVPGLFGDGMSALFYYSNWHQILAGASYFVQTGPTSPFQHTWSLAIEEQFYVIWPLLVLAVAWLITRRARVTGTRDRDGSRSGGGAGAPSHAQATRWLEAMLGLSLLLLIGSAVDNAILFHGGSGLNRVYMGTDTRASGLLAGAALALLMARLRVSERRVARPALPLPVLAGVSLGSVVVLAGLCALFSQAQGTSDWLYPYGLLVTDALSVTLVAVIVLVPQAIVSRIFCLEPLRWLGKISYGLYLWHFPIFLWIDASGGLVGWKLFVVRSAVSLSISITSYFIIEQPIRQRRWPVWMVRGLAPLTAGAGVVALALAASAGAVPTTSSIAAQSTNLAGHGSCQITLANTGIGGEVAPPVSEESKFQIRALDRGAVVWPTAQKARTFNTCPPKRAMLIGDSIAFTIGVPYLYNETDYGIVLDDAATLGCAFAVRGELNVNGKWQAPPAECPNELTMWKNLADRIGANEVIFELGYRDEFDWRWNGQVVHLGQPAFDAYVESRIRDFIRVLGENGKRKLLFLSIPFVNPPKQADGAPAPQASLARRSTINSLIAQAAASDGHNAAVLDIDKTISPSGSYQTDVNGKLCRFDGIHVTVYCSTLLEPHIFDLARALLGPTSG